MKDRIDEGGILKQRLVAISDDETAFSLNLKCYEAGLQSFAELVDELSSSSAVPREQGLSRRTYCGRRWIRGQATPADLRKGLNFAVSD